MVPEPRRQCLGPLRDALGLHFDAAGSPCAGALAQQGFVWLDDLDGGDLVEVDAEGRFVLEGVEPGGHTLEISAPGFMDAGGTGSGGDGNGDDLPDATATSGASGDQ